MFGRVASHGVSLLPVNDTEELSMRATAVPNNTKERVVRLLHTESPVVRCVPFLLLYMKSVLYKYCTLKCAIRYLKFDHMTAFQVRDWL